MDSSRFSESVTAKGAWIRYDMEVGAPVDQEKKQTQGLNWTYSYKSGAFMYIFPDQVCTNLHPSSF